MGAIDKAAAEAKKAVGAAKEAVGKATGNDELRAKGAAQKTTGKAKKVVEDVKDVFRD